MADDREQRIAEARAALRDAAAAGIDLKAQAKFVASTTPAERVQRADISPGGLAAAEAAAYNMEALRRDVALGVEQARRGETREGADVLANLRARRGPTHG